MEEESKKQRKYNGSFESKNQRVFEPHRHDIVNKNNSMEKVKVGLFGVGLNAYWGQFEGLLNRLVGYQERIKTRMQSYENIEVIDAGMVDDIDKASNAASLMKKHGTRYPNG